MIPATIEYQVMQDYLRGDSLKDMTTRHGVSRASIANIANYYGFPRRPRGAPKGNRNARKTP